MWPVFGLVTLLILECTTAAENIQVVKRKDMSIECASNTDLTFKFDRNGSNDSLTIAECDFNRKSCLFLITIHEYRYTISYTGRGGILIIRDLDEETTGTYQCHETYNPMNFVSTMITQSEYTDTFVKQYSVPTKTTGPRLSERHGHIVLGILKDKSIECSSNVDITFKFMSNKSNSSVTIAECDLSKKACTLFKQLLHKKYNLSYTGIGGVLHIDSLNDELFGTYICCETYNPNIFVSIDIIAHIMDAADTIYNVTTVAKNDTENHRDTGGTSNSSSTLAIALSICGALVIFGTLTLGIICVKVCFRMKAFSYAASNDTDNLEMSAPSTYSNATATYPNEEHKHTSAPLLGFTCKTPYDDGIHQITEHDDMDQMHLKSMPSVSVVAAIELGTTYSGYAFSFTHDPNNVVINTNWLYGGSLNLIATKTPTIVLLDNEGEFHSFGFDAEKHYEMLANENTHQGWRLFRRFKMALHKNCSLDSTIDDLEGKPFPAMEIFSMALQFLKVHLLKALKEASPTLVETNIHYVITVPAIWNAEAKHFMRESAGKAGINNKRLTLVVDSVAAATWWTRLDIKETTVIDLQTTGSKWLVVNIGGGSASVLAYEVLPGGKVKVIQQASGGAWGFTNVEQQFMENLDKELGAGQLDNLRKEHIGDYYELLHEIAYKIRSKYILTQNVCVVRLPYSLSPNGKHRIETAKIKTWFDSELSSFIAHIKTVLHNNYSLREITNLVLVDRFAESTFVQNMLRDVFEEFRVIIPPDPKLAVLKGAVLYGHSVCSE